jgi:hypothetical protein
MNEKRLTYIIEAITDKFKNRLRRKTNWGRNEVQVELHKAILSVLSEIVADQEELEQAGT